MNEDEEDDEIKINKRCTEGKQSARERLKRDETDVPDIGRTEAFSSEDWYPLHLISVWN